MNRHAAVLIVVMLTVVSATHALEAPMPRHPAPSPDGSQIAFSWQGDLWMVPATGGAAYRLTANPATERHPVWSRDGKLIAFSSDRYGNDNVFVMPTDGSAAPTRLTFADRGDRPFDFTPDGTAVLFSSDRALSVRWMPSLWTVPVTGGTPTLAQDALGEHASYSPSGDAVVFVRGATKWTRHGYRGAASRTPWFRDSDGEYHQLSNFDGDEDCPGWVDNHTIAMLSSRSERKNVYLLELVNDEATQLTTHTGTDVRFPRVAADGSLIAYEFEDAIWTVAPAGGQPQRLAIDVPADTLTPRIERRVSSNEADGLAVHPDGELAAFVVEGDVYVVEITGKDDQEIAAPATTKVTDTPARESDPQWSPDGTKLLFTSARSGNSDLWVAQPADEETGWIQGFDFTFTRISSSPEEETTGRYSPDGEHIAYLVGKGDLVVAGADGQDARVLFEHWSTPDFSWSPDGKWIAYSTEDVHYNSEVWIISADGGEPYNVSRHPDDDMQPRWSPDGKRLLWVSKRHRDTFDVWGVWLSRADAERTPAQWLKVFKDSGDKGKNEEEPKKEEDEDEDDNGEEQEKKELPVVTIDFDELWRRAESISRENGDESTPCATPDGKIVLFNANPDGETDLYSLRYDGEELQRLTEDGAEPSFVQLSDDGKTIFFLDSKGSIKRIGLDGTSGDPVPFAARVVIDNDALREATFNEAWRALNEWFYDPDFHGVDWRAKAEIYRPWALDASTDRDYADVLNLMLGELNASHMGYYPKRDNGGEKTGWIGATFDPASGGPGLLVTEVLNDSPAGTVETALAAGDRLLAVDGVEVTDVTNVFSLFTDTDDRRVPLKILGSNGVERTCVVIPFSFGEQSTLAYETWVRQRQGLTERYSDGRLGYLHIQSMSIPSFETFERDLQAAAEGREGLIIDVRSNGGGWTTDYLMAVLMVQRHAFTVPRDDDSGVRAYPQSRLPLAAWTRPAATICNEDSYSNAEIFSHAFKSLERGPLVGMPTFGAVISTGGTMLPDGGRVRLPLRGWYVAGTGVNMENNGAVPDVIVNQPPSQDMESNADSQLERAVEVLLQGIETDPRAGAW